MKRLVFAAIFSLFAAGVKGQDPTVDRRIDHTFALCCIKTGVPPLVAKQLCNYRHLDLAGTAQEYSFPCGLVEHWQYIPQVKFCESDGISTKQCLLNRNPDVKRICYDTFNEGSQLSIASLVRDVDRFIPCFDFWEPSLRCGREELRKKNGHRTFFELNFDKDLPRTCDLSKDLQLKRKVYLKLCTTTLKDHEYYKEEKC